MAKVLDKPRMTVDQFLRWAMAQPDGPRYELVAGEVVAMPPQRAVNARRKARIWRALSDAIGAAGLPCEALPDGMTVKIDEHTSPIRSCIAAKRCLTTR
jgi:Uma2 family endonuclease